jgi:L-lactate dehydrogenase (cytochrome)
MDLMQDYPRFAELEKKASRRVPPFAWAYLASGTGKGVAARRNLQALDKVILTPRFLRGAIKPQLATRFLGHDYALPLGVAPIGLSSLIWPGSEKMLARAAAKAGIPYCLSTVAGDSIENIGPLAGDKGWFQLYPPQDRAMMRDLLARAQAAGFQKLLVTADVPAASRREDMRVAGAPLGSFRSQVTPRIFYQLLRHPSWALATLRNGSLRFRNLEKYAPPSGLAKLTSFIGQQLHGALDWDYMAEIRQVWPGPMLLKGLLAVEDAAEAKAIGLDGMVLSNHGGRQFDAAPVPIDQLPAIRGQVGPDFPLIVDSGIRSGLDVLRVLALGADFVLLGRGFLYAVAALGEAGADHAIAILTEEMQNAMLQLGVERLDQLADRLADRLAG